MDSTIRAAVIGLGAMGRNHVRILADLPGVDLVGVADLDPDRVAKATAGRTFPGYTNPEQLFEEARPEMVSVVVPTTHHLVTARTALEAGAHVLVEKPIAATIAESVELAEAAYTADRILTVGHIMRFNPAVNALKERLDAGQGGRVLQIRARRVGPFPHRIRDVGVIHDLGPHDIDVMRFLLEDEIERVYAESQRNINTTHEDLLAALLHFSSGVVGSLDINWLTPTKVRQLTVLCERGLFTLDYEDQSLVFYENFAASARDGAIASVTEGPMTRYPVPYYEPLRAELEAFRDAVRDGTPAPVSARDGIAALAVSDALARSAREGVPIKVEIAGSPA